MVALELERREEDDLQLVDKSQEALPPAEQNPPRPSQKHTRANEQPAFITPEQELETAIKRFGGLLASGEDEDETSDLLERLANAWMNVTRNSPHVASELAVLRQIIAEGQERFYADTGRNIAAAYDLRTNHTNHNR